MPSYFKAHSLSLRGRVLAPSLIHTLIIEAKFTDLYDTIPKAKATPRIKNLKRYLARYDCRIELLPFRTASGIHADLWHAYEDNSSTAPYAKRNHRGRERRRARLAMAALAAGHGLHSMVP